MKYTFKKGTHTDKVIEDAQEIIEYLMCSLDAEPYPNKGYSTLYNKKTFKLKKDVTVEVRIK